MLRKYSNIIIGFFIVFGLLLYFIVKKWPDKYVHIVFCDVGQGDATLIYQGFSQILIDSGANDRVLRCLNDNLPFWDRTIEMVVATHYDSDHIGGFGHVFDFYNVSSMLTSPIVSDSADFDELRLRLEEEVRAGMIIKQPFLGQKIRSSSGMEFVVVSSLFSEQQNKLLFSDRDQQKVSEKSSQFAESTETSLSDSFFYEASNDISENDLSIVLILNIGNTKILLTGDLEEKGEKAMMSRGLTRPINILKVGHHGSKTSSSDAFINQLQPEVAVVSCGENNKYNHPDSQIMDKFSNLGVEVFRTDLDGEIEIVSDGDNYWFVENAK